MSEREYEDVAMQVLQTFFLLGKNQWTSSGLGVMT